MTSPQLDKEERALLDAYEADEFCADMSDARKRFLEEAAAATLLEQREIKASISRRDFYLLQRRAREAGMPYQAFVTSLLRKCASGRLYDSAANKADPGDALT